MVGRIRDEDIKHVRDASPIAAVIGEHLQLKTAGADRLKGLCPFHDEKSPSFHVSPSRGLYHCFGCSEGGDVIDFVMKIDHLSFAEALERLAGRGGVTLRYEQGGYTPRHQQSQRTRLIEAHAAAAEYYAEQLRAPAAGEGRAFLAERGFDLETARRFGVGYAPRGWDSLVRHLRGRGFTDRELLTGGLASQGRRGPIDRFRGRLVWPIRDITGDAVGFGARRLDDQDNSPKYLNTPETPIFKKSGVLYGVDLAKREIARRQQAVVVEGYTDVMACHLSGVPTAIATCGTAFGADHVKLLRRLLMDHNEFRGEVIFTFDGDEAGQRAALRAFDDDQRFVAQTFVAVEPGGMDPCELRLRSGDAAVRDLVARRVPLYEFAIRGALRDYDLDRPEGRVAALRRTAPMVATIRDRSLRQEYPRTLAGWLGMEVEPVVAAVRNAEQNARRDPGKPADRPVRRSSAAIPDDPPRQVEREVLKLALQCPAMLGPAFDAVEEAAFTAAPYAVIRRAVGEAGGVATAAGGGAWVAQVREHAPDDEIRSLVTELAVEPVRAAEAPDDHYAGALLARLQELSVTRRIAALRSRLQRINPLEQADEHLRLFGEIVALEQHRRNLGERSSASL